MDKTYMKYMSQGSGGKYKDKNAPNKTKEPEKWQGDGGVDDGPVTESGLTGETVPSAPAQKGSDTEYSVKGGPEKKTKYPDAFQGDDGGTSDAVEVSDLKPAPDSESAAASKTEYRMKDKPDKKKKAKDGYQGEDGGISDAEAAIKAVDGKGNFKKTNEKRLKPELPMSGSRNYGKLWEAYQKILKK